MTDPATAKGYETQAVVAVVFFMGLEQWEIACSRATTVLIHVLDLESERIPPSVVQEAYWQHSVTEQPLKLSEQDVADFPEVLDNIQKRYNKLKGIALRHGVDWTPSRNRF